MTERNVKPPSSKFKIVDKPWKTVSFRDSHVIILSVLGPPHQNKKSHVRYVQRDFENSREHLMQTNQPQL